MKKNLTTLITTRKGLWAALFLLFTFFAFSCGKDEVNNSAIVGTWYFAGGKESFQPNGGTKTVLDTDEADPNETFQFKSDGTFIYKVDEESEGGSYTLGSNTLTLKFTNTEYGTQTATILQLNNTTLIVESKETGTNDDDVPGTWYYENTYKKK